MYANTVMYYKTLIIIIIIRAILAYAYDCVVTNRQSKFTYWIGPVGQYKNELYAVQSAFYNYNILTIIIKTHLVCTACGLIKTIDYFNFGIAIKHPIYG